jgi:hypothetical protein
MQIGFDLLIFVTGWLIAQLLFHGFEAHVPMSKRLSKLLVMGLLFVVIHSTLGRSFFYGLLALMTMGIGILHGYWFHYKHGIHWRTAEPRAKYLQLIGEEKT